MPHRGRRLTGLRGLRKFAVPLRGAIAQLGERLHGMQEVVGSIPTSSTNHLRVPIKQFVSASVSTFSLTLSLLQKIGSPRAQNGL